MLNNMKEVEVMKKSYTKPNIMFDSFELATSIAAGCAYISTNVAPYICGVKDEELNLILFSDMVNCTSTPPGGNDSVCYDVPTADVSVYTS